MLLKPIRPHKLYQQVALRIEQRIIDRTYAVGDRLPSERDLMREFGVGRPAIREALFHLRNMGLIELRSGERALVKIAGRNADAAEQAVRNHLEHASAVYREAKGFSA